MIQNRMKKNQEIQHSAEERKTLTFKDFFLTLSRTLHISNWTVIGLGVLLVSILFILPKQYTADRQSCSDDSGTSRSVLLKVMEEQQKAAEKQAKDLIEELQQEITDLKKRNTELEQISHTGTHVYVIQMHSSNEKLSQTGLGWAQKFEVDVTLDPDTASPYLILSDDQKRVSLGNIKQDVAENPKRFDVGFGVLAKQGFSSGRFYYEVQVKGKTRWDLGVARESINRKEEIKMGPEYGLWTLALRNENEYIACENPPVSLSLKVKPEIVGVFVDYEEGLVSFYDVCSRSLIYSFTGQNFTDKLYAYFNPGNNDECKNTNPLIIKPVS